MLQFPEEQTLRTAESIEDEYQNCKFILINYTGLENPSGFLYCVSTSDDSFLALFDEADKLEAKHIPYIIMGSYNNGGALGVQYEVKE